MAKLASKTYGEALFSLGIEEDRLEQFYQEVLEIEKVLADHLDLVKFLNHPNIIKEEKVKALETIFGKDFSKEIIGFLVLIIQKERFAEIDGIFENFILNVKEYKKIGIAYVSTPMELVQEQKDQIEKKLLESTPYVELEMHYSIDQSLIGGLVIRIGGRVVDSSIKTKLQKLSKELSSIQLV